MCLQPNPFSDELDGNRNAEERTRVLARSSQFDLMILERHL